MNNYEKFQLTEEEIQTGIDDFFTQILIEARRSSINARTLSDLSSSNPKVSYLVGQPGSGKTTLGRFVEEEFSQSGECAVEISSDRIATFHRDYNELIKLLPEECYTISRQFVRPATKVILDTIREKQITIMREATLNKGEVDYKDMKTFKESGYSIDVNIMAVDKYESFLSCIERDIKLLEIGFDPRPIARSNHDRMYEPFLQELIEMEKRGLCDRVRVFTRGKSASQPILVWSTGETKYASAQDAVICERAKSRREIMSEPHGYLARISSARIKIMTMIPDEKMRRNYIEQLTQLEREFLNELSFDRNIG